MPRTWFKTWGWIYYPVSWQGTMLTLAALLFCAQVFIAVNAHAHSVSDLLYGIFPYWVPTFTILFGIASKTCHTTVQ